MSKLSFRARALDASKPLPVYHADDLPDLSEYNAINRAVPEMPTGMEKEEESVSFFSIVLFGLGAIFLTNMATNNGGYRITILSYFFRFDNNYVAFI